METWKIKLVQYVIALMIEYKQGRIFYILQWKVFYITYMTLTHSDSIMDGE